METDTSPAARLLQGLGNWSNKPSPTELLGGFRVSLITFSFLILSLRQRRNSTAAAINIKAAEQIRDPWGSDSASETT